MPKQSIIGASVSLKRTSPPQPIYTRVAEEGALLPSQFNILNFVGPDVTAAADVPNARVNVTIIGAAIAAGWARDAGPPATVRLNTATDQVAIGTATPIAGRKVTILTTGANQGIRATVTAATDNVLDAGVSGEANMRFSVVGTGLHTWGPGGAVVVDTTLGRSGVGALTLTDLSGAGNPALLPGGGFNFGSLGNSTSQWNSVATTNLQLFGVAADVNPRYLVTNTGGFQAGAGGASVIDVQLLRNAANRWDMSADNAVNNAVTDVLLLQHTTSGAAAANIGTGLLFASEDNAGTIVQAGRIAAILTGVGAGAVDSALDFYTRQAGGALTARWRVATGGSWNPFADNVYGVGTASLRVSSFDGVQLRTFGALGDANPSAQVGAKALQLGEGGASVLDWALTHNAAGNRADLGSNDELGASGTGYFSVRNATADANPTARLSDTTLRLGLNSADNLSVRVQCTANKTLTIDDGAAGAVTTKPLGTLQTQAVVVQTLFDTATPYTMDSGAAPDYLIGKDATGGNKVVNLVAAVTGRQIIVKNTGLVAVVNTVAATPNGAETIDGVAAAVLLTGTQSITLIGRTGVGWVVV